MAVAIKLRRQILDMFAKQYWGVVVNFKVSTSFFKVERERISKSLGRVARNFPRASRSHTHFCFSWPFSIPLPPLSISPKTFPAVSSLFVEFVTFTVMKIASAFSVYTDSLNFSHSSPSMANEQFKVLHCSNMSIPRSNSCKVEFVLASPFLISRPLTKKARKIHDQRITP